MTGPGPLVCPVLVGRDDLLGLGDRRLRAALEGTGHLLFLAGEAGIGKTRLLGSIERRASALGFRSVRGGTYPGDIEVAAAVFLDLARSMRRVPDLAALGERLEQRLDHDARQAGGDAHRRRRVLTLDLAELLGELAAVGPALLSLEDLHQADDLTLEVLEALARRLPSLPLVVVATYRSDELYPRVPMRDWRARLLTQRFAEEARLGRLGLEDTTQMVRLLFDRPLPPPRDLIRLIHDRTDGIPLHVEEMVGLLGASGELEGLLEAAGPVPPAVPDTLDAAIIGRFSHRSDEAQAVARIGAVIGRSFELDLLAAVMDDDGGALARPLDELASHFLLTPSPVSGRYGFRHALICDAIYGGIPDPERRALHDRVASTAATRGDFSDAFLSSHYERAGRRREAFETALRAARAATAISARREAHDLYRRVLRNVPADLPVDERARLLEEHGAAAAAADDNETAVDAFEQARALWLEAGRMTEAAAVLAPLVAVRHLLGDDLAARSARLEEGLGSLDTTSRDPAVVATRARLLAALASAWMLDRRLDRSIAYGEAARTVAADAGDDAADRNAAVTLGVCLVFAGRMDEGWSLLEDGVARSRAGGLEIEAARAYRMLGSCASVLVEYERAERALREGVDYAERVELWNDRHYMAAHLAHVLWATGRWDEAERLAEHALADGRGGITTRITAQHVRGYVHLGRGTWERAEAALRDALAGGERMRELQRFSPALWGLAEVALLRGDARAARSWVERGRAASEAVDDAAYLFPFVITGTRAFLATADPGAAEAWVDACERALRARSIPGTLPALDHARGLLLVAHGSLGRARLALETAVGAWQARGRAWELSWGRLDLARCLARMNRPADAARLAGEVAEAAAGMGSDPLRFEAAALLRTTRRRSPADVPWHPLTAREYEIARLVAEGRTNAEIAGGLGLSPRTVGAHVEHILAKLDVSRRAEIAAWATAVAARAGGDAGAA